VGSTVSGSHPKGRIPGSVQEVIIQERRKKQDKLKFKEKSVWMTEHGNIDDFVASWERQEHVPLMPLAPELLDVTDSEKI